MRLLSWLLNKAIKLQLHCRIFRHSIYPYSFASTHNLTSSSVEAYGPCRYCFRYYWHSVRYGFIEDKNRSTVIELDE